MDSLKCVKFKRQNIVDNVNIVYNATSRAVVFWNKYQIFLFDELKYENLINDSQLIYFSEFKIAQVILSSNYLICLDYNGNVYLNPLKFKHSVQNRIKSAFQRREEHILCINHSENETYSIKMEVSNLYFCIHLINSDFQVQEKINILTNNIQIPPNFSGQKYIFCTHRLNESEFTYINEIFKTEHNQANDQIIAIISFDNLTLYALLVCIQSPQQSLTLIKLITCPSKISSVSFVTDNYLNIIISLKAGTLIRLPLNLSYKTPQIIHLNIPIHKILVMNKTMFYTDGITMWKSDDTFSESNSSFKQFIVKNVKDFIKVADQIICTTYTKLIYLIPIDNEICYLEPPTRNEYCSSEHLLNNCDYLYKIMDEIERNNEIIKCIKKAENHITTLALSNRSDIMDDMLNYSVILYDNYEDILQENITLTFTNNIKEYFDVNSLYFLIKITTTSHLQQKFCDILSNHFGNLKIHIILQSDQKILKTTSIKVIQQLKNINIVVPLCTKMLNLSTITINIKLVTSIPGALNEKETLWTALHCKKKDLYPEHFIKSNFSKNNIEFLKEPHKSINDLIYESACKHHGQLFKINKVTNINNEAKFSFYVRLPKDYQKLFENRNFYNEYFNKNKMIYISNEISSEEFLKWSNTICFIIANESVEVNILDDGISHALLRVKSQNAQIALCLRNFFSNLAHDNFKSCERKFVSNALYDSIQDFEKRINASVIEQLSTEAFLNLLEQYQKNVLGALFI